MTPLEEGSEEFVPSAIKVDGREGEPVGCPCMILEGELRINKSADVGEVALNQVRLPVER